MWQTTAVCYNTAIRIITSSRFLLALKTEIKQKGVNKMKIKKSIKKGFTLIELLVVIVIIGILVAFALPRYYTSAKIAEVKSTILLAKQLLQAEDRYYMIHDTYTKNMEDLDIYVDYERKEENATRNDYYNLGKYNNACYLYSDMRLVVCTLSPNVVLDCRPSNCRCYQLDGKDNICSKLGTFYGMSGDNKVYKVIF